MKRIARNQIQLSFVERFCSFLALTELEIFIEPQCTVSTLLFLSNGAERMEWYIEIKIREALFFNLSTTPVWSLFQIFSKLTLLSRLAQIYMRFFRID